MNIELMIRFLIAVLMLLPLLVGAQDYQIEVWESEVGDSTDIELIDARYPDKYIRSFQVVRMKESERPVKANVVQVPAESLDAVKERGIYPLKSHREVMRKRFRKVRLRSRCRCSKYIGQCYYKFNRR